MDREILADITERSINVSRVDGEEPVFPGSETVKRVVIGNRPEVPVTICFQSDEPVGRFVRRQDVPFEPVAVETEQSVPGCQPDEPVRILDDVVDGLEGGISFAGVPEEGVRRLSKAGKTSYQEKKKTGDWTKSNFHETKINKIFGIWMESNIIRSFMNKNKFPLS